MGETATTRRPTTSARDSERRHASGRVRRPWRRWGWDGRLPKGWGTQSGLLALGAYVLALAAVLVVPMLFPGAAGRSFGTAAGTAVLAVATGVQFARSVPRGLLRGSGWEVLAGVVAGILIPFVAGLPILGAAASTGLPAYAALSPRWIALGMAVPVVVAVVLPLFFSGLVLISGYTLLRQRGLLPLAARWVAGAVSVLLGAGFAWFLVGDVSGIRWSQYVLVLLFSTVFVLCTGRVWGALFASVTATLVWIGLSVAGYVLI